MAIEHAGGREMERYFHSTMISRWYGRKNSFSWQIFFFLIHYNPREYPRKESDSVNHFRVSNPDQLSLYVVAENGISVSINIYEKG